MSLLDDPYPVYQDMRTYMPVCWDERRRSWILTRYADVGRALQDPRLGSALRPPLVVLLDRSAARESAGLRSASVVFTSQLEVCDMPEHARLRAFVRRAFSRQDFTALQAFAHDAANTLLDAVHAAGEMDVVRDLANPLPRLVTLHALGIEPSEATDFRRHVDDLVALFSKTSCEEEDAVRATASFEGLKMLIGAKIDHVRAHPRDGLISQMAMVRDQGEGLTLEEIVANVVLLFAAGHGTTANLIGNGLLALIQRPAALAQLRDSPGLATRAIEELLRYDSPIQSVGRTALADIEVCGHQIRCGDNVMLFLGSANRDEEQFLKPETLDLTREPNAHVAFGHGAHFCIGASLARMQARTVIGAVLRRLEGIALSTDKISWHAVPSFRGLMTLPASFQPACS